MKNLLTVLLITFAFVVGCNGQPNTTTTFEIGIVNPAAGKTYKVFAELKTDSLSSRLNDGMDYLDPDDVTDLDITLSITNWRTVGDTLFGDVEFLDQTDTTFIKAGLVQVDDGTLKYSAMLTSFWSWLDTVEAMNATFFIRRK